MKIKKANCKMSPACKIAMFCINLAVGLILAQVASLTYSRAVFEWWIEVIAFITMTLLSFIMIEVGYEFTIDKGSLSEYGWDYLIAMTAAGFPWVFVAAWFAVLFSDTLGVDDAFLLARFAAPTSAGILFSMLEGAGLKNTWVFQKARILAIFDDLDTILLMIPLKIVMMGFKWEMLGMLVIIVSLLALAWFKLHAFNIPHSWYWTLFYAVLTTVICKAIHHVSAHEIEGMEAIHIEVLLPAFVWGCVVDTPHAREELSMQRRLSFAKKMKRSQANLTSKGGATKNELEDAIRSASKGSSHSNISIKAMPPSNGVVSAWESNGSSKKPLARIFTLDDMKDFAEQFPSDGQVEVHHDEETAHDQAELEHTIQTIISMVFMLFVGLSMPPLVGDMKDLHASGSGSATVAAATSSASGGSSAGVADPVEETLHPGMTVLHVFVVSVLMVLGKMFPVFCYRTEAGWAARLALCLGMCPRGEVGASIIVISLELGLKGNGVTVAMLALAVNLMMSGCFIAAVKVLLNKFPEKPPEPIKLQIKPVETIDLTAEDVEAVDACHPVGKERSASSDTLRSTAAGTHVESLPNTPQYASGGQVESEQAVVIADLQ